MTSPGPSRDESQAALADAYHKALEYLERLDDDPVVVADALYGTSQPATLPEVGDGATEAIRLLFAEAKTSATRSSGPRFFHFVVGGTTPAALAADWLASTLDQNSFAWIASPLGARMEAEAVDWLRQLFRLSDEWGGVLTTGATTANLAGLAAARRWWGLQHGVDPDEDGLAALPRTPVLTGGYVHSSVLKALAMLGLGRACVQIFSRDDAGRVDLPQLEAVLKVSAPAIIVATAGEVNTGDFDPLKELSALARSHDAWLHVDGAFGAFARATPKTDDLTEGLERADSLAADCHKWLNVPYESGIALVREPDYLRGAFQAGGAYLPENDPRPSFGFLGPELSRRARALPVWATLRAYGRDGYRSMVEKHLELARRVAERVDSEPELERLADVPLNVVCFRFRPSGVAEADLDDLNERLGERILADGRVYVGTTRYEGRVAFRPAFVNWRTTEEDVDLLVDVILELGGGLTGAKPS